MALKSLNKLYKDHADTKVISFADWLKHEKYLYSQRPYKVDFEQWANIKYNRHADKYLNFNWQNVKDWVSDHSDEIGDVVGGVAGGGATGGTSDTTPPPDDNKPTKQRFLGLPPVVTYGVGALLLFGVGFGIYKIVKHKK